MWIPPPLRESKGLSLRRYALWQSLLRWRYLLTGGQLKNIGKGEFSTLLEHEKLEYRILQAISNYNPALHFKGEINLIRTQYAPVDWKTDINQDWIKRATDGAQVHVVSGDHGNWLYDHIEELSDILGNTLSSNGN